MIVSTSLPIFMLILAILILIAFAWMTVSARLIYKDFKLMKANWSDGETPKWYPTIVVPIAAMIINGFAILLTFCCSYVCFALIVSLMFYTW